MKKSDLDNIILEDINLNPDINFNNVGQETADKIIKDQGEFMGKKFQSKVNIPALKWASKNDQLYYDIDENHSHSEWCNCDHCGKQGWSVLIAVGKPEEMGGHLQNGEFCIGVGPT